MIPGTLLSTVNHLWQSTVFALGAGLLTVLLRNNRAHTRYCLWLAASLKFLIPFSLLVLAGGQLRIHKATAPAASLVPIAIEQATEPFHVDAPSPASAPRPTPAASLLIPILAALWAAGFLVLTISGCRRWRRVHAIYKNASPLPLELGVPVLSAPGLLEPGVFGVFRQALLLPEGIAERLSPSELHAILAHELCHARRRDNLASAVHMIVESAFWFHPLVWWLGARLMEERERACDEEVLASGSQPHVYAEGILKICELYLHSPLKCVAGVTGANLKARIEAIMSNRTTVQLNLAKKAGLASAGVLAIAIPLMLGITNAPALRAQAQVDPTLRFEVASVRRVEIPTFDGRVVVPIRKGGVGTSDPTRLTYRGAQAVVLIAEAFAVRSDQVTAPKWLSNERYDIEANIPEGATKEQFNVMMQNLLRDRFHLRLHIESRMIPVYLLRVAKNGPKFKETANRAGEPTAPIGRVGGAGADGFPMLPPGFTGIRAIPRPGEIFVAAQDATMKELAEILESPLLGRPITNQTGLAGHYDFKIHYHWRDTRPEPIADPAPSVFDAVEAQLGLKLEPSTAPFNHLTIDSMDREPADN